MASSTWLVSFACAVAACGGGGGGPDAGDDTPGDDVNDSDDGAHSGSRLKLRWIDFGGTRTGGLDAHDPAIDATCYPQAWADGTTRCTPGATEIAYRDPGCTQPVGLTFADDVCPGPPPEFFGTYLYTECGGGGLDQVYRRGDPTTVTEYYGMSGGTCAGPYMADNRRFFTLGAELPRDSLVTLALGPPTGAGRYHQRFWESADGARMFGPVSDETLATDCVLEHYPEDSTATCIPARPGYAHHYSDSTCTTHVAQVATACAVPDYLTYYPIAPTTCPEDRRAHVFTVAGTTTALYRSSLTTCEPEPLDPGWTYHVAGDELAPPALTVAIGEVAGRQLQLVHAVDGTSRVRMAYEQYDVVNATGCVIVEDTTGPRCIPLRGNAVGFYTDAACTASIRLVEVFHPDPSCDVVAPPFAIGYSTTSCPGSYEVYPVGAMYTGPLYRAFDDVTCIEETATNRLRFQLGGQVPLTAFPAGTRVIDP